MVSFNAQILKCYSYEVFYDPGLFTLLGVNQNAFHKLRRQSIELIHSCVNEVICNHLPLNDFYSKSKLHDLKLFKIASVQEQLKEVFIQKQTSVKENKNSVKELQKPQKEQSKDQMLPVDKTVVSAPSSYSSEEIESLSNKEISTQQKLSNTEEYYINSDSPDNR